MEAWEVAAREALRALVAAYTHCGDGGRFDDFCALFAPDGVLALDDDRRLVGPEAIGRMLRDTQVSLRADAPRALIRHHVSSLALQVASPDAARGACYFLAITQRGPDHWGRYRDRYVRRDGRWLFAERRVRLDGMAPGSWAAARRGTAQVGGGMGPAGRGPA